ncbi:hypothetical protein D3C72_2206880 [compost metagenome]
MRAVRKAGPGRRHGRTALNGSSELYGVAGASLRIRQARDAIIFDDPLAPGGASRTCRVSGIPNPRRGAVRISGIPEARRLRKARVSL